MSMKGVKIVQMLAETLAIINVKKPAKDSVTILAITNATILVKEHAGVTVHPVVKVIVKETALLPVSLIV